MATSYTIAPNATSSEENDTWKMLTEELVESINPAVSERLEPQFGETSASKNTLLPEADATINPSIRDLPEFTEPTAAESPASRWEILITFVTPVGHVALVYVREHGVNSTLPHFFENQEGFLTNPGTKRFQVVPLGATDLRSMRACITLRRLDGCIIAQDNVAIGGSTKFNLEADDCNPQKFQLELSISMANRTVPSQQVTITVLKRNKMDNKKREITKDNEMVRSMDFIPNLKVLLDEYLMMDQENPRHIIVNVPRTKRKSCTSGGKGQTLAAEQKPRASKRRCIAETNGSGGLNSIPA